MRTLRLTGEAARIARRIVRAHRALIAPEGDGVRKADLPRTVVACSGGADSSALVVALADAGFPIVIGHVVHDMRPEAEALADRDAAAALAARFGVPFVEARVRTRARAGNAEANARRARYRALSAMATESGSGFIATAHHADDQLETMVMALVRGAGVRGLRGVAAARPVGGGVPGGVVVVRPMLDVTRAEARELCAAAGVVWREDATNADTARLRAALRMGPLASLAQIRPEGARRAARTARMVREMAEVLDVAIDAVPARGPGWWDRGVLRAVPAIVVGGAVRRAFLAATDGAHADRLSGRMVDDVVRVIRGRGTDPKEFRWPGGVRVAVTARAVRLERASV
jgi:tRNA(Ile)-lysidine synthase